MRFYVGDRNKDRSRRFGTIPRQALRAQKRVGVLELKDGHTYGGISYAQVHPGIAILEIHDKDEYVGEIVRWVHLGDIKKLTWTVVKEYPETPGEELSVRSRT